jgi:hypothetical protein
VPGIGHEDGLPLSQASSLLRKARATDTATGFLSLSQTQPRPAGTRSRAASESPPGEPRSAAVLGVGHGRHTCMPVTATSHHGCEAPHLLAQCLAGFVGGREEQRRVRWAGEGAHHVAHLWAHVAARHAWRAKRRAYTWLGPCVEGGALLRQRGRVRVPGWACLRRRFACRRVHLVAIRVFRTRVHVCVCACLARTRTESVDRTVVTPSRVACGRHARHRGPSGVTRPPAADPHGTHVASAKLPWRCCDAGWELRASCPPGWTPAWTCRCPRCRTAAPAPPAAAP